MPFAGLKGRCGRSIPKGSGPFCWEMPIGSGPGLIPHRRHVLIHFFWEFMRNIGCRSHSNRMLHHDVSIWVLHIFAPGLCGQQVDIANICPKVTSWQGPTFGMWKILDLFIHLFHVSSQNVCIFARVVSPAFCAADATRPIQTRPWITAKDHEPNQCCNSTETHLDEISDTSSKRWTRPNESLWRLWRLQWIWRLVRFVYTL